MAEKYAPLCSNETSIFDLPDEILRQIILLLTPRERIPLGRCCQRLKTLVFETRELLRCLDFSKKGYLTTMTDIQSYFNNDHTCQHILRINTRYVECLKSGVLLNNSIGKAINLVELNIHGTQFEDIWQLGSFLKPLLHVEKLSIDWPETVEEDIGLYRQILQRPFSKLTYLSVDLGDSDLAVFTTFLSLCQQLKKLLMEAGLFDQTRVDRNSRNSEIKQLKNLKIVQYHGNEAIDIKEELATMLPDPKRWTDFQLCGPKYPQGFYIEKDVEVCMELLQSERLQNFLNPAPWKNFNLGWAVNPECLLKEVLRITLEDDVPDNLCCLSALEELQLNLLKVEHAKMLLKDPRWHLPYLYLNHRPERGCDAHLLASAFPNLSELVLPAIEGNSETPPEDLDSCFKILVQNTPHMRHFALNRDKWKTEYWDLGALNAISGWKSLESLDISGIPIEDGQFLIEIGKQCKNLQKLFLCHLPWDPWGRACYYEDALFEMLEHCQKLRDVTIAQSHIDQVQMFELLAQNVDLERLSANNSKGENSISDWIESLENLIRCTKLTVMCSLSVKSEDEYQEVESAVERWKGEFRHREFQIEVNCCIPVGKWRHTRNKDIGKVYSDTPELEIFDSR